MEFKSPLPPTLTEFDMGWIPPPPPGGHTRKDMSYHQMGENPEEKHYYFEEYLTGVCVHIAVIFITAAFSPIYGIALLCLAIMAQVVYRTTKVLKRMKEREKRLSTTNDPNWDKT